MSGGGGGGGGGSPGGDGVSCDLIWFDAQLTSPQPAVVALLNVNTILDIELVSMKDQLVLQVQLNGQIVGGLAGPDATRIRNCIDQGHQYRAKVLTINGGQVRVRVEHV